MGTLVRIRQVGREISVADERTILQAALEHGIAYPHGCRSGRCGSCKSRLLKGEVDLLPHTPFALTPEERDMGLILACRAQPKTDATVAWLGSEEDRADHPVQVLKAKVLSLDDATHDIKRVRLLPEGGVPLAFSAGQYAQLSFPGAPMRDYSMANQPGERELEFHIRRIPHGAASERVARTVAVGDEVTVRGPYGSAFLRQRHTGPILAIAGGSGMAPIKSIVETALNHGFRQPIHLYFGVRQERDLYLVEHFRTLCEHHPNLAFIPVLSQVEHSVRFRTGTVTQALAEDLQDLDGWQTYMAGPPAMTDSVTPVLLERGLQRDGLHVDVFFTPEAARAEHELEDVK
ncbi:CDP-4-dehydro-6-deoxyglucose reductase/ferredoxin-NAD(P)+ reductase (naphthalene dioxygenase ferredoxin-specific) [Sinorhizobium kostiense]|uniref:CDP-4-dehydro-6-deoxyglucose reductase/ferredoxin-NAD(P)+ reductase (Naphthalene dioxygenase ferredoxin-specific) n=1 Tax=Sinorhizobium kostiense TaxID=76747 RepID=A0ABS4R1I0_9HYPH|nr:2Fe-2S iron-sulfur cluster-binding protein [Sinorhizobium kostiense]MBP2236737.1 CDP-4-dehydro-6-deoxyglucose reductase/ferredoxin-NAD(P)+ reductase (naphthalene dioxygenase ferredoxin-specific) [Sinorhizobium kostiense]